MATQSSSSWPTSPSSQLAAVGLAVDRGPPAEPTVSHRPLGECLGSIPDSGCWPVWNSVSDSSGQAGLSLGRPNFSSCSGMSEGPLVSVCDPLGATLSSAIREKIVKSEFVELELLLERHIPYPTTSYTLSLDNSGQLLLRDAKKKQQITSIMGWTDAFLVYSSVFVGAHPVRALELFKYMHIIRVAATRFAGRGWLEYDRQFRVRQQLRPHRSWASIDGELWALFLTTPGELPSGVGSYKGGQSSYPKQRSFRSNTINRSSGLCFAFNRLGCSNAQCKYAHNCSGCLSTDHGGSSCKAQSKPSGQRRPPTQ